MKIYLILACCLTIAGCTTSKVESTSLPSPVAATPIPKANEAESPPLGFYLCQNLAYQDSEYSFTLNANGKYVKKDSQEQGTYSYSVNEEGVVSIQWQGLYAPWDISVYRENEGKKIIALSSSQESIERYICQLQAS
ncbi:hypothetical protein FD723_40000 (plasmid) [Nostoc sp. C052]|uniref:hypothetical protein n=1 Tax=Nostoc sp. C052 TaxID=2576902 RepID=UPI0015C301BF|nr:hypothetical protein [Nostoc sp. C052]QLE46397.1 hypothetical protein FD723_40000 [Nostoc sp. C052]